MNFFNLATFHPLPIFPVLESYEFNSSYRLKVVNSYEPSRISLDRVLLHQHLQVALGQRKDVERHGGLDLAPHHGDAEAGGLIGADGFAVGLNAHTPRQ
jgi:hypothetical protein